MGLFDIFKKPVKAQEQCATPKVSSTKTTADKDLEWLDSYEDFYRPHDDKLYELSSNAAHAKTIDEELDCLKILIKYYYQYKNECIAKGESAFKYFSDMHMHCHNSRNPDFDFIAPSEERLKYIEENYDSLVKEQQEKFAEEEKKQSLLNDMDLGKTLKDIITKNPGILQSDVYKMFDPLLKDSISEWLYFSAKDGKIRREKSGRTYQLFWN